MSTFNLRRFSQPESLRAIDPVRLKHLLAPHADFFAARGVPLPAADSPEFDYDGLVVVVMSPDSDTPVDLANALYFIHEMATPEGMDALLAAADERGLMLDGNPEATPADVAVQVWLLDRDLLERKHAEQFLMRARSFEYYQTGRSEIPAFRPPSQARLDALAADLDEWFEEKQRGRGTRVFMYPKPDGVWFLVRHGEPYKREGSIERGESSSVFYRPEKFDIVVYHPKVGELCVNAGSKGQKELYRVQFGRHLFGSDEHFPEVGKYTLEPLRAYGPAALNAIDVDGIEWIKFKEVVYYWGGAHGEIEVRKADDVFAALEARGRTMPQKVRIVQAVFQVKFSDSKRPRSVTIRPPNVAIYTRDGDGSHVEEWLASRGFIPSEAGEKNELTREVLAGH